MVRLTGRRAWRWLIAPVAAAMTTAAVPAAQAAAAPPQAATARSVSFACIGFPQYFNVPPGVTTLAFDAAGGAGGNSSGPLGHGGEVSGALNVTPGHTLKITVGCENGYGYAARGATGPGSRISNAGTGGGGATGITDLTTGTVLEVAAGGVGGNYDNPAYTSAPSARSARAAANGKVTLSYTGPQDTPVIYTCTGGKAIYVVPVGVSTLIVTAIGAAGASASVPGYGNGGKGAAWTADLSVTPGAWMPLAVGCQGQPGSKGSFGSTYAPGGAGGYGATNGGGGGSSNFPWLLGSDWGGCGGGGSTGIVNSAAFMLVAAGGGGCGGTGEFGLGGNGGAGGTQSGSSGAGLGAGGGGGLAANSARDGGGGGTANQGTVGGGGGGGGGGFPRGGGGGAAGYIGGGGGGAGGGGGSYGGPGVTNASPVGLAGYQGANGVLAITPVFG